MKNDNVSKYKDEFVAIGLKIGYLRRTRGLTQEQLAEMANMSTGFLGEVEREEKLPGLEIFVSIAIALDISTDYILRDTVPSAKHFVDDETLRLTSKLSPEHRKVVNNLIYAYVKSVS